MEDGSDWKETDFADAIDIMQLAKECSTFSEFSERISLSDCDIHIIEQKIVGQSSNSSWHKARKDRLTASNFYRVCTKIEKTKQKPSTSCDSLITSLVNPPSLCYLPQIAKGNESEAKAAEVFVGVLTGQGHENVVFQTLWAVY